MTGDSAAGVGWPAPSVRAEAAHRRADELRTRWHELARGDRVSAETVQLARMRARDAIERRELAARAALYRHVEAWRVHLHAAAVYEQAAIGVSDEKCDALQTAAELHRGAADLHQAEATKLTSVPWPELSSAEFFHQ